MKTLFAANPYCNAASSSVSPFNGGITPVTNFQPLNVPFINQNASNLYSAV